MKKWIKTLITGNGMKNWIKTSRGVQIPIIKKSQEFKNPVDI